MEKLLLRLIKDFPDLDFEPGHIFYWSPKHQKIIYNTEAADDEVAAWSLLHEIGHALLGHKTYESDFQLLKLEVAAWEKATKLAETYNKQVNSEHVQDCLDTYRDWLYARSTCPTCANCSLQVDSKTYRCFNCGTTWHVSPSRSCRPYRRKQKESLAQI